MTLLEYYLLSTAISITLWAIFVVIYRCFGLWFNMFEEEEDYPKVLLSLFFASFLPLINCVLVVLIVGALSLSYIATFVRVVILGGGVLSMTEFESDIRFKFTEEAINRMEERRERKEKQRREKQRENKLLKW
jgi:hypothetical protein|nr:MAG TPA: hypothetical protein [Caudoviricetes sp.]